MTSGFEDDWYLSQIDGIRVARCRLLDQCGGFGHGFSSRDSGGADNPAAVLAAAGLSGRELRVGNQVHGARIVHTGWGGVVPKADGFLVARDPAGPVAGIRTADCVPVFLADPVTGQGAAVHSGWKGTSAGIVPLAVALLAGRGVQPGELRAALGPAIGGCCYQVGSEVDRAVGGSGVEHEAGGIRLDLRRVIRMQLQATGIPTRRISVAPWCTCCEQGIFFSWRRDGAAAGRMVSVLGSTP